MRKLRIIVLGTRGFPNIQGGVEKHCEELYPRLIKYGCDITVIARTPYISKRSRLKEWRGIKYFYLWCPKRKSLEAIIHTCLGVIVAGFKSPDILQIHSIGPSILIPLAKLLGLKVVMTHHGPDYERQKWGAIAKLVLKTGEYFGTIFADSIIAISKGIERRLKERNRIIGKINYIPNGVNISGVIKEGETLQRFALKPREYVFSACRFVPEKGLHDLIAAYRKIENPGFRLVIAGDADHETNYSRMVKKIAQETTGVVLTGFISGQPLQELYSNTGLFILPSYYEGLTIVLLEALSYGLPVLVSDISQNREISLPGFRYYEPGNIDVLANNMIELFKAGISEEEKTWQKIILKENYNWDSIAEKTFRVYQNVAVSL